eukprot:SAG31_NODE_27150_length_430_cov_1.392749_2_plen_40_part_01
MARQDPLTVAWAPRTSDWFSIKAILPKTTVKVAWVRRWVE